jgi:hypothetical protein
MKMAGRFAKFSETPFLFVRPRCYHPLMRCLAVLLALAPLLAQDARGRISGRITDASSAAVPDAAVAATQVETGVRFETKATAEGNYELPLLPPGSYTVDVQSAGFKRYTRDAFAVRAGERLTLDIALEVGQVTESVTVSGQAALIETSTATMGRVVDRRSLIDLPLPGGNSFSLARLSAGVVNLGAPNHPSLGPAVEVLYGIHHRRRALHVGNQCELCATGGNGGGVQSSDGHL